MTKLKLLDLFAGIGGFSLGFERTGGFETVAFCEIEPFPQKVLSKNWPKVKIYEDVRELTARQLIRDGITPNIISGGFPCQDISLAGDQAGITEETRSGLWSECKRLVSEIRPEYAIFENVTNLLSGPSERPGGWFSRILCDLAEIGYDAEWHSLPASFVGAWHKRDRVWLLAYPAQKLLEGCAETQILQQRHLSEQYSRGFTEWPGRSNLSPSRFCERFNGVPNGVDRLKSLGNAVVPQITEIIGHAILEREDKKMEIAA